MNTPIDSIKRTDEPLYNFSTKIKGIALYRRGNIKEMDCTVEKFIDPVTDCLVEEQFIDTKLMNLNDLKYLPFIDQRIKGFIIHY